MAERRGRKPGFVMTHEHRAKIQNSNILNALIEHVEGRREMSSTQVAAGLGLLKKVMPDVSAVQIAGEGGGPVKFEDVTHDAAAFARAMARLAAGATGGTDEASDAGSAGGAVVDVAGLVGEA